MRATSRHPEDLGRHVELLLSVWQLQHLRDFVAIRDLLDGMPVATLLENGELALQLLFAHVYLQDLQAAEALLEHMRPLYRGRANDRFHRRFVNAESMIPFNRGFAAQSEPVVLRLEQMATEAGDLLHLLEATISLGGIAWLKGNMAQALRYIRRAMAIGDRVTDKRWLLALHHNLGLCYRDLGFFAESQRHFELSIRQPRPAWNMAISEVERALLLHFMGDSASARALAGRSLSAFSRVGAALGIAECRLVLARIALNEGEFDLASRELDVCDTLVSSEYLLLSAQIHEERAVLAALTGDAEAREAAERSALRLYDEIGADLRANRLRRRVSNAAATGIAELEPGPQP